MDVGTCIADVVAGLMQPDGRAPGTPGGEAATEFLASELDRRGLAAPASGRVRDFPMATRRASGAGTLTWDGGGAAAGDGWEVVPGSWAAAAGIDATLPAGGGFEEALLPGTQMLWWITGAGRQDPFVAQIRVEPDLAVLLEGRTFHVVLPPALVTGHDVYAWVPGAGKLADEVVILAAHRDHLAPLGGVVFPGADDDASGVAGTVCALQAYAAGDLATDRRAVLGIWFDGEEDGMWGSAAYIADPVVPLERTAAVVDLDMVGRLLFGPLTLTGPRAQEWADAVMLDATARRIALAADPTEDRTDSALFGALGIPEVHLFTGLHDDYHAHTDTPDRLDWLGLGLVTSFTADLLRFTTTTRALPPGPPVTDLGIRVVGADAMGHPRVVGVVPGSPAAKAGWMPGGVVTWWGDAGRQLEPYMLTLQPLASFEELGAGP